jgi:predicted dehydrogenase
MKKPLNIAIVGAGMIGAVHLRAARIAGASIFGIAEASSQRRKFIEQTWNVKALSSAEEAIESPLVDVIHVCTPNFLHFDIASAALRAGKHVICEKPLATNPKDAEALVALAAEKNLVGAIPYVYRYHPMVREARARIQSGTVGALQLIHGSYLQDWLLGANDTNWRVDASKGGPSRAFADIGSHWCDLIEWVTGERFAETVAVLKTNVASRPSASQVTFSAAKDEPSSSERMTVSTEDVAAAILRTANGVIANLTLSQVSAGRKNRLWFEIDGANSSLVFDQEEPEKLWAGQRQSAELLVRDPSQGCPEQRRLSIFPAGHAQGYAECFEALVADAYATIQGEIREGLPTFEDGLRSVRIVDAVLQSSATSKWTAIC